MSEESLLRENETLRNTIYQLERAMEGAVETIREKDEIIAQKDEIIALERRTRKAAQEAFGALKGQMNKVVSDKSIDREVVDVIIPAHDEAP